jgi:hypothetical protein
MDEPDWPTIDWYCALDADDREAVRLIRFAGTCEPIGSARYVAAILAIMRGYVFKRLHAAKADSKTAISQRS